MMANATPRTLLGRSVSEVSGQAAYRYDPDGSLHLMETGLSISNRLGWSPDRNNFYLTDSAQLNLPIALMLKRVQFVIAAG